ncbi:MAG TPA: carotenoid oxygenase family protein [Oligoflexus sp.]|uniref:carotenoid oxygenase family protein n=1 Tax=Oligoflexus sp. TaxID=1971216 RepID=UPI002D6F328D|nr:carotenoid oxygenase family protein [Oligoflexus sp.]HYX36353.1 carotenoid oxygenase family protein [Oligoflexus sp.]
MTKNNRRDFLKFTALLPVAELSLAGVGLTVGSSVSAETQGHSMGRSLNFPRSPCYGNREEFEDKLQVIEGQLPDDIFGHAFIIESIDTPERVNLAAGKGAISRVDFTEAGPHIKRVLIRTPSVIAQEKLENSRHRFKNKGIAYLSDTLGTLNSCNTAFVPLSDDRMVITYDAGEPYEIDPVSLQVVTPIGSRDEWKQGLPNFAKLVAGKWIFPMVRTTAHPFYDPYTGEFISVNFGGTVDISGLLHGDAFTHIVTWDLQGRLRHTPLLDDAEENFPANIRQTVHSICVTRNYVLLIDTPFSMEGEVMLGLKALRAQLPETTIWVVPRAELNGENQPIRVRKVILEKEWEHIFADYDDGDGIITLYGATNPASDYSECLKVGDRLYPSNEPVRPDLYGMIVSPMDRGDCGQVRIDMRGGSKKNLKAEVHLTSHPVYNWQTALATYRDDGQPIEKLEYLYWMSFGFSKELITKDLYYTYDYYKYRQVPVHELPWDGVPPALFRYNCLNLTIDDGYTMPSGVFSSSPVFVPKKGSSSQKDGYILCTVTADRRAQAGDELWLFDAQRLSQGPICKMVHPKLNFAFTLHTVWRAQISKRQAKYKVTAAESYGQALQQQPEDIQQFFEQEIFPRFS